MKILVGIICLFLFGCFEDNSRSPQNDSQQSEKKLLITYDTPIVVDSSKYILIPAGPYGYADAKEGFSLSSSYKRGSDGIGSIYEGRFNSWNNRCTNLILFDHSEDSSFVVFHNLVFIESITYPSSFNELKNFLVISLKRRDTNNDRKIDSADADFLYLLNLSNQNLRQISPDMTKIWDWTIDAHNQVMYLKVRNDSNDDNEFDKLDTFSLLKVELNNPQIAAEFIEQNVTNKVEDILKANR